MTASAAAPLNDFDKLADVERTLDEIEARAASRPAAPKRGRGAEAMSALAFAAQAGDLDARKKLRQHAGRD